MVEVGGGHGHIACAIARVTENLKVIVEELPGTVETAVKEIPPELKSRVLCQAQDNFTEQKVKGADVYFFSKTFRDWSDEYCIQILRNLVPATKEGSRAVIYEWERTKEEWKQLLKAADERFGPVEFA
ncbi:S-adenosyl-L-methionine-dependent methyltransferase [Phyllosticta citricarpa]|uniref:S-adenosyl-L-methionine-dependent methyltransferase n=1 Tax=Phyllosticta citricarpa TaxID=55181 RepID=A0ABR1MJY2_9PEZI